MLESFSTLKAASASEVSRVFGGSLSDWDVPAGGVRKDSPGRQGHPKVPPEKGAAGLERQKVPEPYLPPEDSGRATTSCCSQPWGGNKLDRNGSLQFLQGPERSHALLRMEMAAIR